MEKFISLPIFALAFISTVPVTQGATCSCAGVPLLNAMDASTPERGKFNINFTVDVHEISDLVEGSDEINDETGRERSAFSQIFSGSYGISDKWTVSALISRVEHKRRIGSSFIGEQRASGLGDSVILLRYNPLQITPFTRHDLSVGVGARLATGKDDAGGFVALSEDMQPGTGAEGSIVWGSYTYAFNQAATVNFHSSLNYTVNGENKRNYSFGDEINLATGFSYLNTFQKYGLSAMLRYRETTADERLGFDVPNTGGQWLDFVPAISYNFNDKMSLSLSGRLPLKRKLEGALQFTTSYSYAIGLSYSM